MVFHEKIGFSLIDGGAIIGGVALHKTLSPANKKFALIPIGFGVADLGLRFATGQGILERLFGIAPPKPAPEGPGGQLAPTEFTAEFRSLFPAPSTGKANLYVITGIDQEPEPIGTDATITIAGPVSRIETSSIKPERVFWAVLKNAVGFALANVAFFHDLPPGDYVGTIEKPGFKRIVFPQSVQADQEYVKVALLAKEFTRPVDIGLVHIADEKDRPAAQLIGRPIVFSTGGLTPGTYQNIADNDTDGYKLTKAVGGILLGFPLGSIVVSVGGQIANPLYEFMVRYRGLKPITQPGQKVLYLDSLGNVTFVFAAGWTAQDTQSAIQALLSGIAPKTVPQDPFI